MPHLLELGRSYPLYGTANTRLIEQQAAARLPDHTLMQRAGLAVARLAVALAPHARTLWVACGPGNNGGDGLEAAMHLRQWGLHPVVTWLRNDERVPLDAKASFERARHVGVIFADAPPVLGSQDLCIDALLGIGLSSASPGPRGTMATWLEQMASSGAQRLAVDVPSGLNADTGQWHVAATEEAHTPARLNPPRRQHTLSLLTLKPGLFTLQGRDATGTVWFDDLGTPLDLAPEPTSWLNGPPGEDSQHRPHASHKGSWGDVAVVGGETEPAHGKAMTGAALLAARAALHAGAGRVYVSLLGTASPWVDLAAPELMFRRLDAIDLPRTTVVCGCGGGSAVGNAIGPILRDAHQLVLDADALNAIAQAADLQMALSTRGSRGLQTVLTPHPLEAARLLRCGTAEVQADRLRAAQQLADLFQCTVVLKGSGTVISAPGQVPHLNPSGNARLASAGTGDVLAGMVGAYMAAGTAAFEAACAAVWQHGHAADIWPHGKPLTASALCRHIGAR